jgi:tol-pal system beta propeller repeat protein TolB
MNILQKSTIAMGALISIILGSCTTKVTLNSTSSPIQPTLPSTAQSGASQEPIDKNQLPSTRHYLLFHSDKTGRYQIYISDISGSNARQLTNSSGRNIEPTFSPDGDLIAFASSRDDENGLKIYVMNKDGSNQKVLINEPGYALSPKWSPDGKSLVFYANWDRHFQLYTVELATGKYTHLLTTSDVDYLPSWAPDGSRFAFTSRRGSSEQIYISNPNKNETPISSGQEWAWRPSWSSDGTKIIYFKWTSSHGDIFVFNVDENRTTQLTSTTDRAEQNPTWSPDGAYIYFEANSTPSLISLYRMNADGTDIKQITHQVDGNCGYPSVH